MRLLLFALVAAALLCGQTFPSPDLFFTSGRVIARGDNTSPDGHLRLKSYRIEEVRLVKPVEVELNGQRQPVERAFRVIVSGQGFAVRSTSAFVWAGEKLVGRAQENREQTELIAVTYDASLIPDGATLSVSYGEKGQRQPVKDIVRYTVRP